MGWMHFMSIKKVERYFVRNWFPPNYVPLISIRNLTKISGGSDKKTEKTVDFPNTMTKQRREKLQNTHT